MDFIVELCARSEYLGCLPKVAKAILVHLLPQPLLWKSIAEDLVKYFVFAVKVHCAGMYFDSLRHLLSQPDNAEYRELLVKYLGLPESEYEAWTMRLHFEQAKVINGMCNELQRLELFTAWSVARGGGQDFSNKTTYFNKIDFNGKPKNKGSQLKDKIEYLARSQWSQYFAQQQAGERIAVSRRRRGLPAGPLSRTVSRIDHCAKSDHPERLFGKRTAARLVTMMGLPAACSKSLNDVLGQIVKEADGIIKRTLAGRSIIEKDGKKLTYRSSRVDTGKNHWTFFPLEEADVAWEDEDEWEKEIQRQGKVDVTPAFHAQLDAVGIDCNSVQSDESESESGETDSEVDESEDSAKSESGDTETYGNGWD